MEIPPALIQFVGSLVAILLLAGIAWWLRLGPVRRLATEEEAAHAANEACDGFAASEIGLDRDGRAALLRDDDGRVLLLRQHGTHFAGRLLTPIATARLEEDDLVVDAAERRFGAVRLTLDEPDRWLHHVREVKTS